MQRGEIIQQLRKYVATHILDGKDVGLDETTPLLEWGIINSLEIVNILGFIQQTFEVEIPHSQLIAENFVNLETIAEMILRSASPSQVY